MALSIGTLPSLQSQGIWRHGCGNESQAMPGKLSFHHPSQSSKYHTTHRASSPTKVYTIQSLGKRGHSFTYMVNEETLAFFSHCEDKRQDKNVTCLHINPCRLLRNGPLCRGPIVRSLLTKVTQLFIYQV